MKVIYLVIFFSLHLLTTAGAQIKEAFTIVDNGGVADLTPYIEALNNADMNSFRLLSKRVKIKFDTGVEAELFSAKEISISGAFINLEIFKDDFQPGFIMPAFSISENGYVLAKYPLRTKK